MNYQIVLASHSPRRKEILSKFVENFIVLGSNYEEKIEINGIPEEEVMKAAFLKGMSVLENIDFPSLIISADTIVYKNKILGKPKTKKHAEEMLMFLSGEWHDVYTGFAIIDSESKKKVISYVKTSVKFNLLDKELLQWYIQSGEPFDKAGSYGIQDQGSLLVNQIKGDYFNIVGFPISQIHYILQKHFQYKFY